MASKTIELSPEIHARFDAFYELMAVKIREILLVSSPYDAFILEEEGSLASRIINEYKGLNLSQPPRVTRCHSAEEAIRLLREKRFDMVITMPYLTDTDPFALGREIKQVTPTLPVVLLTRSLRGIPATALEAKPAGIDRVYLWSGNSDLLLALVKNAEDRLNIDRDTRRAQVRVLILVEDSPAYFSFLLPLIYKEIVRQTQEVLEVGLNEEHRLLTMRARPKIWHAETFEEALDIYGKYHSFLFGVISDARIPRKGRLDAEAGLRLLSKARKEIPDLPLLLMSSDPGVRQGAEDIPAVFLDKNSSRLPSELHDFFMSHLGFGDFVFRMPDGKEVGRAGSLREMEEKVARIPEECLWYHATRNHFSNWLMARSEIALASSFREVQASEFSDASELRQYIASHIHAVRKWRQKGVVAQFNPRRFDPDVSDFVKIGQGSLGGKARSLAFMSALLRENPSLYEKYRDVRIEIPRTLVISTEGFEAFVTQNHLQRFGMEDYPDPEVAKAFLGAEMPEWVKRDLEAYLTQVTHPLSIRSSSLLEDAQFQPYAGLYQTYMIPNNHPDLQVRLRQLIAAVKLVYASTCFEGPKAFSRSTAVQPQEEQMAVIVQQVTGEQYGDYVYPAVSGVAQSHNYYPIPPMKREDGIAYIALGLGKTVVEGEKALRFSPKHPGVLPQFSTVEDILRNAQRTFYSLKVRGYPEQLRFETNSNLEKREVSEAETDFPVMTLASTYVHEEHRIRDAGDQPGPKIMTFAPILKYNVFPLGQILCDFLDIGRKAMGCPVEIEFSVNLGTATSPRKEFYFLQMRPIAPVQEHSRISITPWEIRNAFCFSKHALGSGQDDRISDIVYVKPADFSVNATVQIGREIGRLNAALLTENRPYLLVGPGRWGSADRWLGIPVQWRDISGVGAIVEIHNGQLRSEPSQGTHFFQNITSLGIPFITITEGSEEFFDWERVDALPAKEETRFLRHVRLAKGMHLKIDWRSSMCVVTERL
ncbi:MAG: PEP/pyruvate-binding domain-containing protein [Thermodesulfobacteriota bacterium]